MPSRRPDINAYSLPLTRQHAEQPLLATTDPIATLLAKSGQLLLAKIAVPLIANQNCQQHWQCLQRRLDNPIAEIGQKLPALAAQQDRQNC
jgi:hypothetical protein